jgi:hypothetical protein
MPLGICNCTTRAGGARRRHSQSTACRQAARPQPHAGGSQACVLCGDHAVPRSSWLAGALLMPRLPQVGAYVRVLYPTSQGGLGWELGCVAQVCKAEQHFVAKYPPLDEATSTPREDAALEQWELCPDLVGAGAKWRPAPAPQAASKRKRNLGGSSAAASPALKKRAVRQPTSALPAGGCSAAAKDDAGGLGQGPADEVTTGEVFLRGCFLRLKIAVEVRGVAPKFWPWAPKTKGGKGAGEKMVGDYIPHGKWPCRSLPSIDLDSTPGRLDEALRRNRSGQPLLLRSVQIDEKYRHAAANLGPPALAAAAEPYLGRGRKAVVLFPFADREKLVVGTYEDGRPKYLNPLVPPEDPGTARVKMCWPLDAFGPSLTGNCERYL